MTHITGNYRSKKLNFDALEGCIIRAPMVMEVSKRVYTDVVCIKIVWGGHKTASQLVFINGM